MVNRLPEYIEPFHLADKSVRLTGTLDLGQMTRLCSNLSEQHGQVFVDLRFERNEQGIRYATGHLSTRLRVLCQRCLEPMEITLNSELRLELVDNAHETGHLPENFEPFDLAPEPISLIQMVEDELILSSPAVPRHSDQECSAVPISQEPPRATRSNPFAVLSTLKDRR